MKKALLFLMLFAVVASAQNYRGYSDSAMVKRFGKDTVRITKPFLLSNADSKNVLIFQFDDTAYAGRITDSVLAEIGYQLGYPISGFYGTAWHYDTMWSAVTMLDTVDATSAAGRAKMYNPAYKTAMPQFSINAIDTVIDTSASAILVPFTPNFAPYIRFYIHGLEGTHHASTVKGMFIFEQKLWTGSRQF